MDEFLNRITAQRAIINIINQVDSLKFPLVGLSATALKRWRTENLIAEESKIMEVLLLLSSKLFFLANKSQEQITNDYLLLSKDVRDLIIHLEKNINDMI